jgi:hypothetical protein
MKTFRLTVLAQVLVLSSALVFSACKDDDDPDPSPTPTPAATITFATPTVGQEFSKDSTIRIRGSIVTAAPMHGYRISIRNHDNGTEYFFMSEHGHGTNVAFDTTWVNTLPAATELDIEVSTLLNHDSGVVAAKRIEVKTAP